jgi:hypothetical protein
MMIRFCKGFGISLIVLSNFPTQEAREQYVVDCIKSKMNEELKEMNKKHQTKWNQLNKFEQKYYKEKVTYEKDKADVFKWLNIKTPYK